MCQPLHGLIQHAKLTVDRHTYIAKPGGKGFRLWRKTDVSWICIGELADLMDVVDFIHAKMRRID